MAGYDSDDEDEFFGDELDSLPQSTFLELELKALQSTQHPRRLQVPAAEIRPPLSSNYGDDFEDDDLDDALIIDEAKQTSVREIAGGRPTQHYPTQYPPTLTRAGGSASLAALTSRPLRPAHATAKIDRLRPDAVESLSGGVEPAKEQHSKPNLDNVDAGLEALQRQILELQNEREQLKRDLNQKAGEIAIVRSKHQKATQDYEREIKAVRKLNNENAAKQQKAIETAKEAEKAVATELEFVKRDLAEEAEKLRRLTTAKDKDKDVVNGAVTATTATPKKNKTSIFRDGFEDDEIHIVSPSKFHGRRSNNVTPTKAVKRKRKVQESPAAPLEVALEDIVVEEKAQTSSGVLDEALLERLRLSDDRLNFLEAMFNYKSPRDPLKSIEMFTQLSFPSNPKESFASIIVGQLPTISTSYSTAEFPVQFCELITSLWERCLNEKLYSPIHLFVGLLSYALELKSSSIAPFIIDTLLPIVQTTGDIIAIPRFKRESSADYEKDVDITASLSLLRLTALGCVTARDNIIRFWRLMRLDFVLMILSQHQDVRDFDMMLQLLTLSVTIHSVGPIEPDAETQPNSVRYIIDRMSLLLVTLPTVPTGGEKHDLFTIQNLRLQILRTLNAFCQNPWGAEAVARHSHAIGRMVKLISDEVDSIYDYRYGHKQSARIVSLAVRLVHHLVTNYDKFVNMQQKLSVIHGGSQKYLISLARLNVSVDELVLGANIDPVIAECAHELLELNVTPEEGDTIYAAFSNTAEAN